MTCKRSKVKSSIKYKKKNMENPSFLPFHLYLVSTSEERRSVGKSWKIPLTKDSNTVVEKSQTRIPTHCTVDITKLEKSQANVISVTIHPLG